jgi:hypothetical protein
MPDSNLASAVLLQVTVDCSNRKQETVPLGLLKLGQLLQPSVRLHVQPRALSGFMQNLKTF